MLEGGQKDGLGAFLPQVLTKARLLFEALLFAKAQHHEQGGTCGGVKRQRGCVARARRTLRGCAVHLMQG